MQDNNQYNTLTKYLENSYKKIISFTFKQIEHIIGEELPHEAYEEVTYWNNDSDNQLINAIKKAKYTVEQLNMEQQCVMFVKAK